MKNKRVDNLLTDDKIAGNVSVNNMELLHLSKNKSHREFAAPKIVVYPPVEDVLETRRKPYGERLLKALSSRLSRHDSDSEGTSCSSGSGDNCQAVDSSSCSVSESGSDGSERQRRNQSIASLRRVFQRLNLTSRSQSCTAAGQRKPKKQKQPQRILRSPVTYTYVRGLSGLPTQRVPRPAICCASQGLNR